MVLSWETCSAALLAREIETNSDVINRQQSACEEGHSPKEHAVYPSLIGL